MTLQIDGNLTLQKQSIQLQTIESFFVEVTDYQASDNGRNDITTKDIDGSVEHRLQLRIVSGADELARLTAVASVIVFDRENFVEGRKQRVVGFRTAN